ncbi:hypothetical protein CYMTET_4477 [Cymbomonas tetramitiformis]|uniref:Uncharacterized protein n=1 Tax=Cymbomonas tetramitiformis TaxID=36881 RepID=A0AAE0H2U7_9CHLO|nr:hypothetical protein CYMTET_4477 [Cymbomonas tetramitiformis]
MTMAGIAALGGAVGYAKAKSVPSLVAGVTCGTLFGISGYLIQQGENQLGHDVGAATSGVFALALGSRMMKTRKMMPGAPGAILGSLSCAYHAKKSMEWRGYN